jgi:UDP-N-acetylmuramyl tripeptide synthase
MGEVAAKAADFVWLTSDNPRNEDPMDILVDIRRGIPQGVEVVVEADRARAIHAVLAAAAATDVLLVAGKGHETCQEIAGERRPFSDAAIVREALAERAARKAA